MSSDADMVPFPSGTGRRDMETMQTPVIITASTTRATLRRRTQTGGAICLAKGLTASDLCLLARKHANEDYADELALLIVNHPACDSAVHRVVVEEMCAKPAIANSIATSGRAPEQTLVLLLKHPSSSVRNHASLAVQRSALDRAAPVQFRRLLNQHRGDGGVSLGIRHMLAVHPRTPEKILRELTNDDADFIAAAARKHMEERARKGKRKR